MIEWLSIKNLALVDKLEVELSDGFNVITGETGAGKSVILGAINLLLGERAEKSVIRTGTDKCEISAGLNVNGHSGNTISTILDNAGIQPLDNNELQLKRIITSTNSRNFINDTPATLQTLKQIGDELIDIHGPNEHQSLLKPATQLELLDRYGHHEKDVESCKKLFESLKKIRDKQEKLLESLPSPVEAEHLRLVVSEIEKTAPSPGEDENISNRHKVAASSKQLLEITSKVISALNESEGCITDRLGDIYRSLVDIEKIDPEAGSLLQQCDQLVETARELSFDIERYAGNVDIDEQEFYELEERLQQLQTLKRRYGPSLENVLEELEKAQLRLTQFDNSEKMRQELNEEEQRLIAELKDAASKLSRIRQKTARKFSKEVTAELQKLGFIKAEFNIDFKASDPGPNGSDKIEFLFTANPGEPLQSLRKSASSGEVSRVMLALKTVSADADAVPVLIFDEIDVNIGGKTAVTVGENLAKLGNTHQILCISHLAPVAAKAKRHFVVDKHLKNKRTLTTIVPLDPKARISEVTRMLGTGKAAQNHAKELLES